MHLMIAAWRQQVNIDDYGNFSPAMSKVIHLNTTLTENM